MPERFRRNSYDKIVLLRVLWERGTAAQPASTRQLLRREPYVVCISSIARQAPFRGVGVHAAECDWFLEKEIVREQQLPAFTRAAASFANISDVSRLRMLKAYAHIGGASEVLEAQPAFTFNLPMRKQSYAVPEKYVGSTSAR